MGLFREKYKENNELIFIEQNELNQWISQKGQAKLRQGIVKDVKNNIRDGGNGTDAMERYVLPGSFKHSPRKLHELYHNSMAIVRELGKYFYKYFWIMCSRSICRNHKKC